MLINRPIVMVGRQIGITMRNLIFLIISIFIFAAHPNAAHAQKEHVKYYKQFNEALEAGDLAAAAEAGERAWRAAETELGDNQTTAVLAYNYAAQIYFPAPDKAIEPLERVIEIVGEGNDMFGAEAPALMLAFARNATSDERRNVDDLRARLEAHDAQNTETTLLSARGWYAVGSYELGRRRFRNAVDALSNAMRHFESFHNFVPLEIATTLIARGIGYVAGKNRKNDDIVAANFDFNDAIALFPAQSSIETFDPLLATAVAWDAVSGAAATSDNVAGLSPGTNFNRKRPELKGDELVKWAGPRPSYAECDFQWKPRRRPRFPTADAVRDTIGGVFLGYHIEGTKVVGARVLAEVPERSQFGERALSAVSNWELEKPLANPACGRNLLITYQFILK